MGNMSYCRFENTYRDMLDCKRTLDDLFSDPRGEDELSASELAYAKKLVNLCANLVTELKGDEQDDYLDSEHIAEMLDQANIEARASGKREEELDREESEKS